MAIGVYFSPDSFPVDKYDESTQALADAGHGAPEGRQFHFAFKSEGGIHVFDVWDSQETFEAFGANLVPILAEYGVDPGTPAIAEIHNMIVA
jgi:hypothetical protein